MEVATSLKIHESLREPVRGILALGFIMLMMDALIFLVLGYLIAAVLFFQIGLFVVLPILAYGVPFAVFPVGGDDPNHSKRAAENRADQEISRKTVIVRPPLGHPERMEAFNRLALENSFVCYYHGTVQDTGERVIVGFDTRHMEVAD